jgi:prepilin-type N-terminal cleavage/methylation domain-containing protein
MNSPKKEAGFTLMEILIAIAILAFGLLAIATMQAWSIKGNSKNLSALITTTQTLVIKPHSMAPPRTLPPMTALMTMGEILVWTIRSMEVAT